MTFPKVPLHALKYESHMNLGIYVDPTTYAQELPLLFDKCRIMSVIVIIWRKINTRRSTISASYNQASKYKDYIVQHSRHGLNNVANFGLQCTRF